jgi:hypothetical protein
MTLSIQCFSFLYYFFFVFFFVKKSNENEDIVTPIVDF